MKFARVKAPAALPRFVPLREAVEGKKKIRPEKAEFLLLESLIQANLAELFPGLEIVSSHLFRVTRDADIEIQEDEASDLLATIEQEVRRRRFGAVVRLEVAPEDAEARPEAPRQAARDRRRRRLRGGRAARTRRPDVAPEARPPRAEGPALHAGASPRAPLRRRFHLRGDPRGRHPPPPPLRLVRPGRRDDRAGGRRHRRRSPSR